MIFDHSWVEAYYKDHIEHAMAAFRRLQIDSSGYGETHRNTARQARELAKWRI